MLLGRKVMTNLDSVLKNRDITLLTNVCLVKGMVFPVVTYGHESWGIKKALKNWCFQIVVFEKIPESPLECKEIKPVNSKGNQPRLFNERTDAEADAPILWPLDAKNWHWKRSWCWERLKAGEEGDNRGWDGWRTGDGGGQGSLVCFSPWGCKELDTTEWLNNDTACPPCGRKGFNRAKRCKGTHNVQAVGFLARSEGVPECCQTE